MTRLSSLSIVIPLYNNEETIGKVIDEAFSEGKKYTDDLEVLVLDDGSSDNSFLEANKAVEVYKNIKLLRHLKNLGFGATIKKLYKTASKSYIFSLPADRQIRANVLGRLIKGLSKYDMIIGKRAVRRDSFLRVIQSKTYNKLLKTFFNLETSDVNSTKLFRKKIVESITLISNSAFVDAELCVKAKRLGFLIEEVEIEHYYDYSSRGGGGRITTVLPTFLDFLGFISKALIIPIILNKKRSG